MTFDRKEISGADIIVPSFQMPPAKDESTLIFRRLRQLKRDCGTIDRHAIALILIEACIEEGINTRNRIRGALERLGMNPSHAVIMLNGATGDDPSRHRWQRDVEGVYSLLPPGVSEPLANEAGEKSSTSPDPVSSHPR